MSVAASGGGGGSTAARAFCQACTGRALWALEAVLPRPWALAGAVAASLRGNGEREMSSGTAGSWYQDDMSAARAARDGDTWGAV